MEDKILIVSKSEMEFLKEHLMIDKVEEKLFINSYGFKGVEVIELKEIKPHQNNISISMKNSISYKLPPPYPIR